MAAFDFAVASACLFYSHLALEPIKADREQLKAVFRDPSMGARLPVDRYDIGGA